MAPICDDNFGVDIRLIDRVSKLLESRECSDCTFVFNGKVIKAHKLILGISSPVFKAMLYGPMATTDEIHVTDIEPHIFQLMLDFIYTDKILISSLEECCNILYAAKKYMIESLERKCLKFIENNISIDEVICIFNFADFIQDKSLWNICLNLICLHADIVLQRDADFLSLSCLKAILSQDKINVKESVLVLAVMKFLEQHGITRGLNLTNEQKRDFLETEGIISRINFPALKEDLLETNLKFVLTDDEISDITESKFKLFKNTHFVREELKLKWCLLQRDLIRTLGPVVIDSNSDSITTIIRSTKTVFVNGFNMPTRMSSSNLYGNHPKTYQESIILTIKPLEPLRNSPIYTYHFEKILDFDSTILLKIPEYYVFEKNTFYAVKIYWPGVKSAEYCVSVRKDQCQHKSVFTFGDSIKNLNFCSFIEGISYCI